MLPIQEIEITTTKNRKFLVHLENWEQSHFECKLAAINLGPQLPANATFGPFSKGHSAEEAFGALIDGLKMSLGELDKDDSLSAIDNLCNTELIGAETQNNIVGNKVSVKVNGK